MPELKKMKSGLTDIKYLWTSKIKFICGPQIGWK
jgi:hypothetical protein